MPAGPFELSLCAAGVSLAGACRYFYQAKQTVPFKATYFLAWPVLGSGLILLATPHQNTDARSSLDAFQVMPAHLKTSSHATEAVDALNKALSTESAQKSGSRSKWRLMPLVAFVGLLATAVTLIIFHTREENALMAPSNAERAAQATESGTTDSNSVASQDLTPDEPVPPPPPPPEEASKSVKMYTYEIVRQLPHDAKAFTQGLEFEVYQGRDVFWESTGIYKKSQLREVHVDNGTVIRAINLPPKSFGEGLTRTSSGGIVQLTWKTGVTFEYPAVETFHTGNFTLAASQADSTKGGCSGPDATCDASLAKGVIQRHTGLSDGWGIASDGAGTLIVTDSSETMYWLDEITFGEKRREVIKFEDEPLRWVNELEWIEGEVWGNVWYTPCIARIDPATASVQGWINLEGLKEITAEVNKQQGLPMDVLNGIAYDSQRKRIFVTGKKWALLFEIKVVEFPEAEQAAQLEQARTVCKPPVFPV